MGHAAIPAELADLLERAARHPQGWAVLREGCLEAASTCLGLHPFVLEAARGFFATDAGRRYLEQATLRGASARGCCATPVQAASAHGAESPEARALIAAAEGRAGGLAMLQGGAVDEIARTHAVHPYTVFRARGVLERYPYSRPDAKAQPARRS